MLLTGSSGFIGRPVLHALHHRNLDVHTIGRNIPPIAYGDTFHELDLLTTDSRTFESIAAIGADTLIHIAWCTEPGLYWSSIDNLRWMAVSLKLVDAFLAGGGKRVLIAGTCAEYDWRHHTLTENETPLNPSTIYGQTKASLHKTLSAYLTHHGISFAWGHIFFPYGPGEKRKRLLSDLACSLLEGKPIDVSAGDQIRDFMHVADVAEALVQLAESDVRGAVNIASGDPRRLRDIIEMLGTAAGNLDLVRFGGRPPAPNDPPCLAAAVSRLTNEVGFRPRYRLEQGIISTVDWWKANQNRESHV